MSYICIFPKQASRERLLWLQKGVCVDASLFVSYIAKNDSVGLHKYFKSSLTARDRPIHRSTHKGRIECSFTSLWCQPACVVLID